MNNPTEHGPTFQEQAGRSDAGRTETGGMMGTIRDKARDLASGAADMAGTVKDKAKEWGQSVAHGAERAWDTTRDTAQQWGHTVADTASDAWDGAGNFIRRYPIASLGIAFGIGFILGGGLAASRRSNWS